MSAGMVCACGARGEHIHCPALQRAVVAPERDDLREAVLLELRRRPARSANAVAERVPRQRRAVLAALRELVTEGRVAKTAAGLEATR